MLVQSLLATTLALTSFVAADSNMSRFRRGLPPLPQKHVGMRMKRQAVPSGTPFPNVRVKGLRVNLPDWVPDPVMQFSANTSVEFYSYELVSMSSPGLPGTFSFTGFYTDDSQPIYVFSMTTPPAGMPYLVAAFPDTGETIDGNRGGYLGAGPGARHPYPSSDQYTGSDITNPYTQAAIFTIDKTDPAGYKLNFVTLDINSAQLISTQICLDGDGQTLFLPFLWNGCSDAGYPVGDVYLDLA